MEYPLNVIKLFWSRSDIIHVAVAWDNKPLLLLTTALLPNRTTESFQMEAGPPYDKQRIQMGLRKATLTSFISGVELSTTNVSMSNFRILTQPPLPKTILSGFYHEKTSPPQAAGLTTSLRKSTTLSAC